MNSQAVMISQKIASGGGGFSPSDLTGLKLWLKADALALSDTDPVSTWTDSSGSGNDATGTSTARPLYRTGIIGGKPAVRFDGSNDILTTTYVFAHTYTIFVAYNRSTNCPVGAGGIGGTGMLWRSALIWSDVSQPTANLSSTPFTGAWSYIAVTFSGLTNGAWLNGSNILSSSASPSSDSTAAFQLGNSFDGYSSCDIAEVIVYNSVLGTTDRQSVEGYLHTKYGI